MLILDNDDWAGVFRDQKLHEAIRFDAPLDRVMPLPTWQGLIIST